jgi:transcriptional regulator with XRE-family HTH domain
VRRPFILTTRPRDRPSTSAQLASATGISIATIRRLERNEIEHPSVRMLSNCAKVLEVELEDLVEDEWREWFVFDATNAPKPPVPWLERALRIERS